MTIISTIYQQIPASVKEALLQQVLHRVGGLILDENNKVHGLLQSTTGFLEEKEVNALLSNAAQYAQLAQLGIRANPVAFGIHAAGSFSVISYQMEVVKNRLEEMAKVLDKINAKVDIGYYSKFKAAIELASHAFSMNEPENKLNMAHKAIQLFVETKNIYTQYLQQELEQDGRMIADYFLIVVLSYFGQVKCCLELEELDTAKKILVEGTKKMKPIATQYVQQLLSDNPAIYLHNDFEDLGIDLRRLTKIYNWLGQEMDENQLFKDLRTKFISIHTHQEKAVKALPKMIWNPILDIASKEEQSYLKKLNPLQYIQGGNDMPFLKNRLKENFEMMEQIMESYDRFHSALFELELMAREGTSYEKWTHKIAPKQEGSSALKYIEMKEPIELLTEDTIV